MISVVLPARNPHPARLQRALAALGAQRLARGAWELLVIDNGSTPAISPDAQPQLRPLGARVIAEPRVGLTAARLAGIRAARGDVLVFVDDDNVLDSGYLEAIERRFAASPSVGAAGGPVVAEWESPPPAWTREFHGLLALRERSGEVELARGGADAAWPEFAPVGAGLAIRRRHALDYDAALARDPQRATFDRAGASLASGGDNDLVFTALHAGGDVAYFPELKVTHLIPAQRLAPDYLARLNRGIMRTWVRVLHLHGQCPWREIAPSTVPLRVARAWFRFQAWRGPAERVRWSGARGQFEGLGDIASTSRATAS